MQYGYHSSDIFLTATQHIANAFDGDGSERELMVIKQPGNIVVRNKYHPYRNPVERKLVFNQVSHVGLGPLPENRKELVIDVDLDKNLIAERMSANIPQCSCGFTVKLCIHCWNRFMYTKLRTILNVVLIRKFGISPDKILSSFSGRRGFHIIVTDPSFITCTKEERVSVAKFIVNRMKIKIDEDVTTKIGHLLRCPLSQHEGSGWICLPVDTRLNTFATNDIFVNPSTREGKIILDYHAKNTIRHVYK